MENFQPTLTDEVLFSSNLENVERPIRPATALKWNRPDGKRKLIVNIVAPNGGGKSVFPKMLCALDPEHYWVRSSEEGCNDKIATVCPNLGWATVGFYRTKCGGCDALIKNQIFEGIFQLMQTNLHVVVEGSIVANTKTTYWDAFKAIKVQFPDRVPAFIMMDYPYETYLKRVLERNGGQPIKEDMLQQKYKNIERYKEFYRGDGGLPIHLERSEGLRNLVRSMSGFMNGLLGEDACPLLAKLAA
jgi:hypothetical protein